MAGLQTGGFDLTALPQAPNYWPSNIGKFDSSQVMANANQGLDLANKTILNPLTMQADTTGLQAQVTGNQLQGSEAARQLSFAKAQEANMHQDAANYARMQSDQYAKIGASGNPASFTGYNAMVQPTGGSVQPTPPPGDFSAATPPGAQSPASSQAASPTQAPAQAPQLSGGVDIPTQGVLSSASPSVSPSSTPGAQPGSPLSSVQQPQSAGGISMNSPLMGGIMTIPGANGQLSSVPVAPSPLLSKFVMGIHPVPIGTDKKGIPMYQNYEQTLFGEKVVGLPYSMTSQAGGSQAPQGPSMGQSAPPVAPEVSAQIQQTYGTEESPQMRQARLLVPAQQKLITEATDDDLAFQKANQAMGMVKKAVYANNGLMEDPSGKTDAQGNPVMIKDPNANPILSGPLGGGKLNLNAISGSGTGIAVRGMLGDSSGADLASARSALVGDVMSNVHNIRNINEYKGVTALLPEPTQPPQTQLQNVWNAQKKLNSVVSRNNAYRTNLGMGMADGDASDMAEKQVAGQWGASAPVNGSQTAGQPNTTAEQYAALKPGDAVWFNGQSKPKRP